ncbi:MAG: response regulator [Cyanobacteria bacterium HKST-UBA06]|nr:response regulator [Cyanobacteria bacterium HKST-UBA06]MCA9841233.1 response regulator [Cyanobacteria bacterium HKST-UBA03]
MKCLVVDDSAVMRKILIRELGHIGIGPESIIQADDGKKAVWLARAGDLDLILMDWNMPEMKGVEAVAEIRCLGIATPILMVTSEGEARQANRAMEAGANDYLIKPFSTMALFNKVSTLLAHVAGELGLELICPPPRRAYSVNLDEGRIGPVIEE